MRTFPSLLFTAILSALATLATAQVARGTQTGQESSNSGGARTAEQAIDRVIAREQEELAVIKTYHPVVETYVQVFNQKKDEERRFARDYYYLGQADLADDKRIRYHSMLLSKDQWPKKGGVVQDFNPIGFVQMVYIDRNGFDRKHYRFQYVGREFLGDVRCVMFDVKPLSSAGPGRFYGRIWAEDKDYAIVRFNGIYLPAHHLGQYNSHFDSWRANVQPGLWLPTYAFAEEADLLIRQFLPEHFRFKAQTRFWGYSLTGPRHKQEYSDVVVDSQTRVKDDAANQERDRSPLQVERDWQRQAENNVTDALERTGLMAPAGEVDKVLDAVVNNLEVTNNLNIEPAVHCRVVTTATFDMFAVGHLIVISRGLLDVLPDEATLATILAQELGEIIVSNSSPNNYGFYDIVQLPSLDALKRFSFKLNAQARDQSAQKALVLLRNSPYKDKLGGAGLFLKQFDQDSRTLRALVDPHLGNRVYSASELIGSAPPLQPDDLKQVAALPLGARIRLDPWTDGVELVKAKSPPLISVREKMPLEVTPLTPYLTRYAKQKSSEEPQKVALDETLSPGPN